MKPTDSLSLWRILGWCVVSAFFWKLIAGLALLVAAILVAIWCYRRARRIGAAIVLLFYSPRKNHEPKLHAFCYPETA